MSYDSVSKRIFAALMLTLLLVAGLALIVFASPQEPGGVRPERVEIEASRTDVALVSTDNLTHHAYLPLVAKWFFFIPRSFRVGYCATWWDIARYPDIGDLSAGWYVNFGVHDEPSRPLGIEHVQTVRLHQLTECWDQRTPDRDDCPYVEPHAYVLTSPPTKDALRISVAANRRSLWLIGNEMDRIDWEGGGQDEMLPELYAQAYHELHDLIKDVDPTALVAIGGVIQATPARLQYLDKVWNAYQDRYGEDMPVDVWNVHNFILKEDCNGHGAGVPPGYSGCKGTLYDDKDHDNMEIFDDQIRAFRKWMKDHGQQNKPLIVSEYGILYHHVDRMYDPDVVREFMLDTFDYFMNEKDCELGYPADDCRLVQRWAWFSLDSVVFNQYARLFDPWNLGMSGLGRSFAGYTEQHLDVVGSNTPDYWPRIP